MWYMITHGKSSGQKEHQPYKERRGYYKFLTHVRFTATLCVAVNLTCGDNGKL